MINEVEEAWQDDEANPVIAPALINLAWTSEAIAKWKNDRLKKYPTVAKGERAAKIKEVLSNKRQKIQEVRQQKYLERQATRQQPPQRQAKKRKRNRDSFKPRDAFQFPDCDNEENGVKDGIFAFCGTKSNEKSADPFESHVNGTSFNISDEEDDIVFSKNVEAKDLSGDNAVESDDEPPEVVSIKKVTEDIADFTQNTVNPISIQESSSSRVLTEAVKVEKSPVKQSFKAPNELKKDYVKILRGPRRDQTFLEKLLEPEMIREKYEILQCLHYICSQNFFMTNEK